MNIKTSSSDLRPSRPIRDLIDSNIRSARPDDPKYIKMLDEAISAYERSKVVADRELELFAVGVECVSISPPTSTQTPTQTGTGTGTGTGARWAIAVSAHNN